MWNSDTCTNAAVGGHLEALKWARANGCEWDAKAAAMDNEETKQWIHMHVYTEPIFFGVDYSF